MYDGGASFELDARLDGGKEIGRLEDQFVIWMCNDEDIASDSCVSVIGRIRRSNKVNRTLICIEA